MEMTMRMRPKRKRSGAVVKPMLAAKLTSPPPALTRSAVVLVGVRPAELQATNS